MTVFTHLEHFCVHVPREILASFHICHVPYEEVLWLPFKPDGGVNKYGIVEIPLEDWEVDCFSKWK